MKAKSTRTVSAAYLRHPMASRKGMVAMAAMSAGEQGDDSRERRGAPLSTGRDTGCASERWNFCQDFSVRSITSEDNSDEEVSRNSNYLKSPVEELDYFVDNIHGTTGNKAIIDPNGNDEIVGISDLMVHTRVRSALRETIVDEGIVESFVPDAGGLANSIDSLVQST